MNKQYLIYNTFEAAEERIKWVFDTFDKIYLSFSGGKDSTVMFHIAMKEAIKRNKKIGLLFIDLEVQYKLTIEHIEYCIELYKNNIELYWIALPLNLRNAVSVFEPQWTCWDKNKTWTRKQNNKSIININHFKFYSRKMEFEEFCFEFGQWYSDGKEACNLIGIRCGESMNRYMAIAGKKETKNEKQFTTKISDNLFNVYPIYDWNTKDIWTYHAKNKSLPYNKVYDLMHLAGLSINQMRICQPYGDDQRRGIWLYQILEPETWSKMVNRVSGRNSGSLYINEKGNINGYGKITKPFNQTWQIYLNHIIDLMPLKTKKHYTRLINKFVNLWIKRGYENGIPDEGDYKLEQDQKIPSYRRICKAILKNDYWCKGLGFSQDISTPYKKYLSLINRKENKAQLKIFEYEQLQ